MEVTAEQSKRIRELVEAGMTPDKAFRDVLGAVIPSDVAATPTVENKPKRNKYGAIKQERDGYTFDSTKELRRYEELKLMLDEGAIEDLEVHPSFVFEHNGVRIGRFTPDFQYLDLITGEEVVEDVKSKPTKTEAYGIRKRLLKAFHGIDLKEV